MVPGIDCRLILSAASLVASALKGRRCLVKGDNGRKSTAAAGRNFIAVRASEEKRMRGRTELVYQRRVAGNENFSRGAVRAK